MTAKQKPAAAAQADTEPQLPAIAPPSPPSRALTLDLSVQDLLRQKRAIAEMLKEVLVDGTHYGPSFPGDDRKTLHQPGADALIVAFGLVPRFDVKREDIAIAGEGMHREYTITCTLFTRSGQELGSGIGSCSTMESKYRWRNDKRKCPQCGKDAIIKGKAEYGGGWLCFAKKDGCGAKWPAGAIEIEGQIVGKVPNPDIADTYNTILKLGAKRAKVAATILVTGCADMFTQDLDEQEEEGDAPQRQDQGKSAAPEQRAPSAPGPAAPPPAPPVAAAAQLEADLAKAHKACGDAIGKETTSRAWKGITDRAARLDWLQRAAKAGAAIRAIRGPAADELIADLTINRAEPDTLDGILADLERFAAPPAAAKAAPAPAAAKAAPAPAAAKAAPAPAPAATAPAKPAVAGDDEPPF